MDCNRFFKKSSDVDIVHSVAWVEIMDAGEPKKSFRQSLFADDWSVLRAHEDEE